MASAHAAGAAAAKTGTAGAAAIAGFARVARGPGTNAGAHDATATSATARTNLSPRRAMAA
eukprot:2430342-Amphidinium_carterae.1